MTDRTIYYFSGAGNSMAVAKKLSEDLDAQLLPMKLLREQNGTSANEAQHWSVDALSDSIIGIVFPVHGGQPPKFVVEALSNLSNIRNSYLFAVCTYGISPGRALYRIEKLIKARGGTLSVGFAVGMPQSGIGCYHWCPQGAVSFGGHDMDTIQFHHPDVTVGDMIGNI